MSIKNNQIENTPKVLPQGPAPVVGPGEGSFYPRGVLGITEGFFVDDQNREIQLTENGNIKLPPLSGEANTASNLGAGNGVFASKSGVDLRFKSIVAGTNVSITNDSTTITINATGGSGETNTASNLGLSGEGVFASKVGVDLQFKKLIQGTNVTLSSDANSITINATGGSGEINTASNLGAGQGVYSTKVGVDLRFKSLVAGTNVSLSADSNQITINATGGSGETNTASNLGLTGEGVFASKVGVDLQFKKLIAGTNTTLSSDANSITINSTGGGGSTSVYQLINPRYQVVSTSGEEAYMVTYDPYAKADLSWTRATTTISITSSSHGLSNGDWIVLFNTNIAQQAGAISNVSLNAFDFTTTDTGSASGSLGAYQRGASLSRSGSTITFSGPSDISYITASFRVPSSVTSPLILDYGVTGLNTSASDRFPPQVNQWREDTLAQYTPGTGGASLTATFDQMSISMPSANRIFKITF